jgi:hypothetical protein
MGFGVFFGITALINAYAMNVLYWQSEIDDWMDWIGPALVVIPFACMLFYLEKRQRSTKTALIISILGVLPVMAIWILASMLFMV